MKKVIIVLFIILGSIANAEAQKDAKTPEQKATNASNKLAKNLGLSDDVKAKVKDLALDRNKKIAEIKSKNSKDKKATHSEIAAVRETYISNVNALLTPEQAKKWEQLRKEKMEKRKDKKQGKVKEDDEDGE